VAPEEGSWPQHRIFSDLPADCFLLRGLLNYFRGALLAIWHRHRNAALGLSNLHPQLSGSALEFVQGDVALHGESLDKSTPGRILGAVGILQKKCRLSS